MGRNGFLVAALLLSGLAIPAAAAVTDEVSIELVSGEVVGRVKGQGRATVTARVVNDGTRPLSGVRVEAYYSTVDIHPPASATWRPHEFVFDPPLQPGESVSLTFTDENAAEFVLLSITAAVFHTGLSYNGIVVDGGYAVHVRDGVPYIATRDLVGVVGGGASYESGTSTIILRRDLHEVRLWEGTRKAVTLGGRVDLEHPVIPLEGRSFVPLPDVAPLLGLDCTFDETLNVVMLNDSGA